MSETSRQSRAERIKHIMNTEGQAVRTNTRGFNAGRYESVSKLEDYEALKDRARAIKADAIQQLPELIDQVTDVVEENGGTVYLASDAADANQYIARVCADQQADRLIKSKSMTSEEIEINDHLERKGVDVVETDLVNGYCSLPRRLRAILSHQQSTNRERKSRGCSTISSTPRRNSNRPRS